MSAGGMRIVQMMPAPEHTYRITGVTREEIDTCGVGGVATQIESVAMLVALVDQDHGMSEIRALTLRELSNRAGVALNEEPTPYTLASSLDEAKAVARTKLRAYVGRLADHEDEAVRTWASAHNLTPTPVDEFLIEIGHGHPCLGCAAGVAEP
jgi:hypothetical protein